MTKEIQPPPGDRASAATRDAVGEGALNAAILDALPAHIALLDRDGTVLAVNQAWRRFAAANVFAGENFGVGENYLAICDRAHGDCSAEARDAAAGIRSVLDGTTAIFTLEYPCHAPHRQRWFRMSATPLDEGKRTGVVVMHADVTAYRQAEIELTHNVRNHRALFEYAPLPMWIYDRETLRFLVVNRAAAAKYGYTQDEFLGLTLFDIRPAEEFAALTDAVARGQTGLEGRETWRHRTKDGRRLDVEITSLPTQYDGRPAAMVLAVDVTARRAAEAALRRSQAVTRFGERIGRIGGWEVNLAANEVSWSPGMFDILEWDADQPPPLERALDLYPPEYRDQIVAALTACANIGTPFNLKLEIVTAKGRPLWVRAVGEPERDAAGRIVRVIGAFQDITEQERLAAEHEDLRVRLGTTLETMTDAFYLLDRDWRFVFLNAEAARLMQRQSADLVGHAVWEMFPEARGTALHGAFHAAMADGAPRHFEFFFPPLDGWFDIDAYPQRDGMAVYFRLITERKRLDAQLKESEERFRIVAQATADVVWDWNLVDDTIWWNEGMRILFGYAPQDLPRGAASWTEHIHADDRARVVAGIHAVIDGSATDWSDEYRYTRADGSSAQVTDRGFVIRDEAGTAVRMVGSMVDVTERRKLEEQLRQSQRLDAVGQLTGGVAHDFNNLLTVILGNAELLEERLTHDPKLRPLAAMTRAAAERGAALTNRLLAFSRRQALDPKAVDVNRLVAGMDGLLRRTLGEHIEIETVHAAGLWDALVDAPQLESAVLNLCLNARDAMPSGGRLTIETANVRLDDDDDARDAEIVPGQYAMLAVSDNGTGMAPDIAARAFDPFFTTKEVGKGSGLGLSMVYGFVKQSKGHVRIYSELGHGTTVKLYLPRAAGPTAALDTGDGMTAVQGGSERILLVEDDELVRHHVAAQLEGLGYRVFVARNAAEALAVLRRDGRIDLLFTDIVMPGGINGRQLADEARRLRPELPVLFTSGYSENAIVHHGRLDAGVHLLNKPYRRQDLAAKIREVLATRVE